MDIRLQIFQSMLMSRPPGHLLDLGTGHGKFALLARDLGWRVTAVDARSERFPTNADGINWVQSDIRSFSIGSDDYDCIAVLGLLYHLELDDALSLLKRCCHVPTLLDTHVSLVNATALERYSGRLFREQLSEPTASWGNAESFWPTEPSLMQMLHDCGYGTVFSHVPRYRPDRNFWICLPAQEGQERPPLSWVETMTSRASVPHIRHVLRRLGPKGLRRRGWSGRG